MGKLHELLAAEPELKRTAQSTLSKAKEQFQQVGKFLGHGKNYRPLIEDGETFPDDVQPMATTVDLELEAIQFDYGRWIDAAVQKEEANQRARATLDLERYGVFDLPATALLNLEDKLDNLRKVLVQIPTNDPAVEWIWDDENNHYRTPPMTTYRTEKTTEAVLGYPATEEHPAQVHWQQKDVRVGEWIKAAYSGMFSAQRKSLILFRVDELLMEVKKARQRANQVEVEDIQVSKILFDYIFTRQ